MYKIHVIGDGGVGKSTLITKLADIRHNGQWKLILRETASQQKVGLNFLENELE